MEAGSEGAASAFCHRGRQLTALDWLIRRQWRPDTTARKVRGHIRPAAGEAELGYLFLPKSWARSRTVGPAQFSAGRPRDVMSSLVNSTVARYHQKIQSRKASS